MTEPFISNLAGESRIAGRSDRFKRLREIALSFPRDGRGHQDQHRRRPVSIPVSIKNEENAVKGCPFHYKMVEE